MAQRINIEVYYDAGEIFATLSEHPPDLPSPFDKELQNWAEENSEDLEQGEVIEKAGELVYQPDGEITEMRTKQ